MNMSTSECSSGCESGWTTYLDHSSVSPFPYDDDDDDDDGKSRWLGGFNDNNNNQQVEDPSMLSDASSGPTYFYEAHSSSTYFPAPEQRNMKHHDKIKEQKQWSRITDDTYLDDTASSSVLSFYNDNKDLIEQKTNQEYSASRFKEKSALKKHFGSLKSSVTGKSRKSGSLQGRKSAFYAAAQERERGSRFRRSCFFFLLLFICSYLLWFLSMQRETT